MPETNVIKTDKLSKNYGKTQALKDFSIEVPKGQVLGLLGPNGAGKSTFIKSLVGGVKPSSGNVEVFGQDPLKNKRALSHNFGYMPQDLALYGDMSAFDNIHFFAKLHNRKIKARDIEELLDFLGILDRRNDKVSKFSGGMERRVSLAAAMVHEPEVLMLDEPTAGLDPALKRSLWQLFKGQAKEGKTLIVSTHLMEEAILCDSLAIIRNGKLITINTPEEVISKGQINVKLERGDGQDETKRLPAKPAEVAEYFQRYGLDKSIEGVDIRPDSLEDIVIRIMEDE